MEQEFRALCIYMWTTILIFSIIMWLYIYLFYLSMSVMDQILCKVFSNLILVSFLHLYYTITQ